MKKLILHLLFLTLSTQIFGQEFTWINGTNSISAIGNYGTQGVSAPSNSPGERHGSAKWVDTNGDLWFFGGEAPAYSWWNDLWKYSIATNEWTWIRGANTPNALANYGTLGVSSLANDPGAREFSAYWTDNSGNFWLFGGKGYDGVTGQGNLSDLWKYNPTTNEWTWVKGPNLITQAGIYGTQGVAAPSNNPGGRQETAHWTDLAGNLWLFGGDGHTSTLAQGRLNDLWKYDIANNTWTWISGSNAANPKGSYGTLTIPSTTNHPGGRLSPSCWQIGGEMYLFGGLGRDSNTVSNSSTIGALNDLWRYNPAAGTWVWLGGSATVNPTGNYGVLGISSPATIPLPREAAATWVDSKNMVWLLGGIKTTSSIYQPIYNDLFLYNPTINEWTWMNGANIPDQNGNYGTLGVSAPSNMPGSRAYSTFWTDLTGKLWLFGGEGYDAASTGDGHLNDLWSFSTPCNPDSITIAPGSIICSGTNATLTAVNGNNVLWYPSATSTSSISAGATIALTSLTATASQSVFSYYAEANSCTTSPRASITITVNALPTLTATTSNTLVCSFYSATLSVIGASSYTWSTNPAQISNSVVITPTATTIYTVNGTDSNSCSSSATLQIIVTQCPGIKENNAKVFHYSLYPNPSKGEFKIKTDVNLEGGSLTLINALGEKVYSQALNSDSNTIKVDLIRGVYFYVISDKDQTQSSGKLIIE